MDDLNIEKFWVKCDQCGKVDSRVWANSGEYRYCLTRLWKKQRHGQDSICACGGRMRNMKDATGGLVHEELDGEGCLIVWDEERVSK